MKSVTFGEVVKNLRIERGISQTELAKRAGISVAEVCRIEKDKRQNPSMKLCVSLLRALEMSSDDFLKTVGYAG